jgi:hypothetical protein
MYANYEKKQTIIEHFSSLAIKILIAPVTPCITTKTAPHNPFGVFTCESLRLRSVIRLVVDFSLISKEDAPGRLLQDKSLPQWSRAPCKKT